MPHKHPECCNSEKTHDWYFSTHLCLDFKMAIFHKWVDFDWSETKVENLQNSFEMTKAQVKRTGSRQNEWGTRESKRQEASSAGNRHDAPAVCMWQRKNKQTNNAVYSAQSDKTPPCLLFVFSPPSISKTWLKCSSYQRLCWTMKKQRHWDGKEKWSWKVKSIFYGMRLFIHRQWEGKAHRHSNFSLFPISLCLSLSAAVKPLTPEDNPAVTQSQWPSQNDTSIEHLFQRTDIIPSAPFSPITLCHVAIWVIVAVPRLRLRTAYRGLGRCCGAQYAIWRQLRKLFALRQSVSYLKLQGAWSLG